MLRCVCFQELRSTMMKKHVDDMQAQMTAHKATVESVKEQAETAKLKELQEYSEKAHAEKGSNP